MGVKERWAKRKEIKLAPKEIIKLVKEIAHSHSSILALYIFGSLARSTLKEGSDVDIAIYTTKDFSWDDFYQLYGEITSKLRSDRVDLVWLNKADPIISFEIIKTGKVLFFKDADQLNEIEVKIKKSYYDYVSYLRKHRSYRENDL